VWNEELRYANQLDDLKTTRFFSLVFYLNIFAENVLIILAGRTPMDQ